MIAVVWKLGYGYGMYTKARRETIKSSRSITRWRRQSVEINSNSGNKENLCTDAHVHLGGVVEAKTSRERSGGLRGK
jgi:hypothetical protein